MSKRVCAIWLAMLSVWFFLDMTGLNIGSGILVTRAWREDGLFFLVHLAVFVLFLCKENIGKWVMTAWLSICFLTQFAAHEWYTIFGWGAIGSAEGKIHFFSNTIPLVTVPGRYIPDLYHIVLHLLILISLICCAIYAVTSRRHAR